MSLLYQKDGIPIVKCKNCGLGKACAEHFDAEEYYDSSYFNGSRPDGYSDYLGASDVLKEQFQSETRLLEKLHSGGGKLLEIGCAYGYFLEVAQRKFSVHGLEICDEAVIDCQSRGLKEVRQGAVSEETLQAFPMVDVLVLLDVIEHLPQPDKALEEAVKKLLPGGKLLITTGDFSSLCSKIMGRNWRLMTPPQHLWYFTPESIKALGQKLGLEVIYVDHPFKKVPLGLILYQIFRYVKINPSLPNWIHKIGLRVNLFDAMRIVLCKKIG